MSPQASFPEVTVAVAVLARNGRVMLTWNPRWGSFSLPMTKIRDFHDPRGEVTADSETAHRAAVRAAAEALGRPLTREDLPAEEPLPLELQPYNHRGHRDGRWKRYDRKVFVFHLKDGDVALPDGNGHWVRPADIAELEPISPTATEPLRAVASHGLDLQG